MFEGLILILNAFMHPFTISDEKSTAIDKCVAVYKEALEKVSSGE